MRGNRGGRQGELLSTAVIALYSELGRRRERERERERAVGKKQSDTQRRGEREGARERESGPALTAHIAGWLAGSLTVDE